MNTCKNRCKLDDSELIGIIGGNTPNPTGGHSACDVKKNPTSTQCTVSEESKKPFADLGDCENCRFNSNM